MAQAERARKFYNRIAGVYDALADASEREARTRGLELLRPEGAEKVLEIGVGTGQCVVEIAERLSDEGRVQGVDIAEKMLTIARERADKSGVAARVGSLEHADARNLPYQEGSFDAVFLSFTLELFSPEGIVEVLAEIERVLRPRGRLGVVSLFDDGRETAMIDFYRFLHRHFPHIVDCEPIDSRGYLEQAGFAEITSDRLSIWGLPVLAIATRANG